MAKILQVAEDLIRFDDGTEITTFHCAQCCEHNYADCEQIDDIAKNTDFDTANLEIELIEGSGFRFGNKPFKMFFVPCYSRQNGYYSCKIDIYINNTFIGEIECEEDFI